MSIRIVPVPRVARRSLMESALRQRWRQLGQHWHLLSLTGYVPSQDLAGDDRPETALAMAAEVYGWAGLEPDAPLGA